MESIHIIHPASINVLINNTWEFTKNTLWSRFPFYESEIEMHKRYIRNYYERISPELFPEIAHKYFISYCTKILLLDKVNLYETKLNTILEETFKEVLNESDLVLL